jgi:hypothetical protein
MLLDQRKQMMFLSIHADAVKEGPVQEYIYLQKKKLATLLAGLPGACLPQLAHRQLDVRGKTKTTLLKYTQWS